MANKVIPGKLLLAGFDTTPGSAGGTMYLDCQQDATLTITYNLSQSDPCKPDPSMPYKGFSWQTQSIDSAVWELSFTIKATDGTYGTQNKVISDALTKGANVNIVFQTSPAPGTGLVTSSLFEGAGVISSIVWNAPTAGDSTVDITVSGNGEPTFTTVPAVT